MRREAGLVHRLLAWCGWESDVVISKARSGRLTDYGEYPLSRKEFFVAAAVAGAALFAGVYLFYHSAVIAGLAAAAGIAAPRFRRRALLMKRQERLKLQFKEALFSLTSSLAAGRSLENAFLSTLDDLKLLYPDPRTELLLEFQIVRFRLDNAEPIEYALRNFADRAHIEEIDQFVDALAACKRSGGDLLEVMKRTAAIIGEKLEIEQEIAVMVAQKRFEGKIMMAVPFVFLAFLGIAAPDYMAPLYAGAGYLLLTGALLALLLCFRIMGKIMDIRM
ncbi:type II secretion system F family protein [Paenibacillus sp. IB182493]|uniref:Type II secretion system F family protein n=2 Tax=Paenibacillus arenilitoris TaxID=2772299 RepID=A0A927CKY4_9BACL|nr:type II secretion system F family protein [Paenibacillus arenilitoris]